MPPPGDGTSSMAFAVAEQARHPLSHPSVGAFFDDACSGFARAADRSVAPSRFDARISPDAGNFTTRDPGVSLDRTLTGWLSSAC